MIFGLEMAGCCPAGELHPEYTIHTSKPSSKPLMQVENPRAPSKGLFFISVRSLQLDERILVKPFSMRNLIESRTTKKYPLTLTRANMAAQRRTLITLFAMN
jgi:hypothetical protein